MKTLKLFLGTLLISTNAWAFGGIHDGGGQVAIAPNGRMTIADSFAPKGRDVVIQPGSTRVDPLADNSKLKPLIAKMAGLFVHFGGLPNLNEMVAGQKYFAVAELPAIEDCRVPRDNSDVPQDRKVVHIACTQGSITLLKDAPEVSYKNLDPEQLANVLVHEAFRGYKVHLDTYSIENFVSGLDQARVVLEEQMAGKYRNLTDDEFAKLQALQKEIRDSSVATSGEVGILWQNGGAEFAVKSRPRPPRQLSSTSRAM